MIHQRARPRHGNETRFDKPGPQVDRVRGLVYATKVWPKPIGSSVRLLVTIWREECVDRFAR